MCVFKGYRNFEADLENVLNRKKMEMVTADIEGDQVRFDNNGWYER